MNGRKERMERGRKEERDGEGRGEEVKSPCRPTARQAPGGRGHWERGRRKDGAGAGGGRGKLAEEAKPLKAAIV